MTTKQNRIDFLKADLDHSEMLRALAESEGATSEDLYYDHDLYINSIKEELHELGVNGLSF